MLSKILLASLAATALTAKAADDTQAYFAILAETKVQLMPGMPKIELPPGIKLPPGVQLPGAPKRELNIRLWSPSIAPPDAKASVAPPAGLKKGAKLDLQLYRPDAAAGTTGPADKEFDPDSTPDFTIKIYWGSSTEVREGQPKIIKWTGMTDEQKAEMKKQAREAQNRNSYFYKPNWTTGYWPARADQGGIEMDASLVGKYALTTTYTGNVEIEAPSEVDFLDPFKLSSPDLSQKLDLKQPLPFAWEEVPNAIGLYGSAMGMEGKNVMILWSSSETFQEAMMGDMGFMQMADVRANVEKKLFLPGNATNVTIPRGIFANVDFSMFNMYGWGHGAALEKAQPLPRIQTKSSMMLMLGGKKMRM